MRKKVKHIILFFIICLIKTGFLFAQEEQFQIIKGLPTNEVYDLMVDSKGLLWIAHDLGLSTYDGKTIKNYSCKEQKAKAITGLLEDKYGRVWCHNFSSQVFWVKDDEMHLLKEYDAAKERLFPTITICDDELIASSSRGFFIYNLKTGKSNIVTTSAAISPLVPVKNGVCALMGNFGHWTYYQPGAKVKILKHKEEMANATMEQAFMPQNLYRNDTIFAIENPAGICARYKVTGDSIAYIDELKVNAFINCVTADGTATWVHTKTDSYLVGTNEKITGYNLTDIVTDKEGNRWFSSLKYGLLMQPVASPVKLSMNVPLRNGDYLRNMIVCDKKLVWGTQGGDVFIQDSLNGKGRLITSFRGNGSIERFYMYDSTHVVINPSIGIFLLDLNSETVTELYHLNDNSTKEIAFSDNCAAISTNVGLLLRPKLLPGQSKDEWLNTIPYTPIKPWKDFFSCWKSQRCRSAVFSPFNKALLASFKDGVMEFKNRNEGVPLLYHGQPIDANMLLAYKGKVFMTTVFDDILVYDKNGIHPIVADALQQSKDILLVRLLGNELWIISSYGIKVLDANTESLLGYYELPGVNLSSIVNVSRCQDKVLFVTSEGVYAMPVVDKSKIHYPQIKLLYATANNGSPILPGMKLSHSMSDLRFYTSVPWFAGTDAVTIAYRLQGDKDTNWQYINRSDQPIHYSSLAPGNYIFEVKAIHRLSGYNSEVERLSFIILKPWWQLTWFWIGVSIITMTIIILLMRRYYAIRLQKQKRFYEQELAVEKERQRISADIHDELGGTLSGIKLMTEMTERKYDESGSIKSDLHNIHISVTGLSQKLREVIWSLNNENNSLENLLDYLLRRSKEMFQNSEIQFHSQLPKNIPAVQLKGDKRRHIYLAIKEALHNALKHSGATDVSLNFEFNANTLNIIVQDNGEGFIPNSNMHGNGLKNMQARMEQVNGLLLISKENGVTLTFVVPLVANTKMEN